MEINDFFNFSSKLVSTNFLATAQGLKYIENFQNDYANLIKGDFREIIFPVIFREDEDSGKKMTDILDTGSVNLFLISDRLKVLLEKNHLSGWKTYPIKLYDKKNNEIPDYHGFSIIGHCTPIDYEKSEIIEKHMVPTGTIVKFYKGIQVDNWDGTDFFFPDGSKAIFITKKTADILNKNKITNMRLTDLANEEIRVSDVKKNSSDDVL